MSCSAYLPLLLSFLPTFIPDWMSIVLANTLIFAGTILNYIGLERFVGKPSAQLHNYVLLGLFAATFVFLTHIHPRLDVHRPRQYPDICGDDSELHRLGALRRKA